MEIPRFESAAEITDDRRVTGRSSRLEVAMAGVLECVENFILGN
jgi:hypothetical protein